MGSVWTWILQCGLLLFCLSHLLSLRYFKKILFKIAFSCCNSYFKEIPKIITKIQHTAALVPSQRCCVLFVRLVCFTEHHSFCSPPHVLFMCPPSWEAVRACTQKRDMQKKQNALIIDPPPTERPKGQLYTQRYGRGFRWEEGLGQFHHLKENSREIEEGRSLNWWWNWTVGWYYVFCKLSLSLSLNSFWHLVGSFTYFI